MKTITQSLLYIFLATLFFSSGEVKADERVRFNMDEVTRSGSIVRHYKDEMTVACYHHSSPFFMMYQTGVTTTDVMYLPPMDTICDFVIYQDTVYFCGKGTISRTSVGIVGYFPVADLLTSTSSNVAYVVMPSMDMVKAIKVGWFAERKHVVGVGESIKPEGKMVDMIDESTYWNVNFGDVGGDTISLSDLEITQNKVVVTSMSNNNVFAKGRLWYFSKPTVAGASLFPCYVFFTDQGTPSLGKRYGIQHIYGDNFVTVYRQGLTVGGVNRFVLSYYNAPTYFGSTVIEEPAGSVFQVGDISKTDIGWIIGLLVYGTVETNAGTIPRSMVYELPTNNSAPSTIQVHVYDGVFFESIYPKRTVYSIDYQHFSMSGYQPFGYGAPYFMEFHAGYFEGNCLGKREIDTQQRTIEHIPDSKVIGNTVTLQIPEMIPSNRKTMKVETQCYSPTHEHEKE